MHANKQKIKIYLAGPISNCNDWQIRKWRGQVKKHWKKEFDFIDPADSIEEMFSAFEVVRQDIRDIERCDAVLANMWKESIGTTAGIVRAARAGKVVVVVDPNQLRSKAVTYYASSVVSTPKDGIQDIKKWFKFTNRLHGVIKKGGQEEPFQYMKLLQAIGRACRDAKEDDLLLPKEVLRETISSLMRLKKTPGQGKVTSTSIRDVVEKTFRQIKPRQSAIVDREKTISVWNILYLHDVVNPFNQRVDDAWNSVISLLGDDRAKNWYWEVLVKFKPRFVTISLGIHADIFDVCTEISDFLNQVLEAFPRSGKKTRLTLGSVKKDNNDTGTNMASRGVQLAHSLRGYRNHARIMRSEEVLVKHGVRSKKEMLEHIVEASETIGRYLGLNSLKPIASRVMKGQT